MAISKFSDKFTGRTVYMPEDTPEEVFAQAEGTQVIYPSLIKELTEAFAENRKLGASRVAHRDDLSYGDTLIFTEGFLSGAQCVISYLRALSEKQHKKDQT